MNPLRLGVIGCGNVLDAYRVIIEKFRARGEVEVTLACGRESQRGAAAALGAKRFTLVSDDVIGSDEVDIVLILTSMNEHAHLEEAALKAGKHVLVEKPIATKLDEAQRVVDVASKSRGYLLCAPFVILSPTFQIMAERIRAGDIGGPALARGRYGWAGPWWSEWFYKPGGGCLFDLGVYCFTSLTGLLGPAKRVSAMMGSKIAEREINGKKVRVETEDTAQVTLDFGNTCFGVVTSGFTMQQYRNPGLEIYGTTGTIQMLGDDWDPDGYELWQNAAGCWQVFKEKAPDWPWADGLRHLIECVRAGRKPTPTPEHALHVLEIMLKAQEAARTGRTIEIESRFEPPRFGDVAANEPAHLMHDRSREHLT